MASGTLGKLEALEIWRSLERERAGCWRCWMVTRLLSEPPRGCLLVSERGEVEAFWLWSLLPATGRLLEGEPLALAGVSLPCVLRGVSFVGPCLDEVLSSADSLLDVDFLGEASLVAAARLGDEELAGLLLSAGFLLTPAPSGFTSRVGEPESGRVFFAVESEVPKPFLAAVGDGGLYPGMTIFLPSNCGGRPCLHGLSQLSLFLSSFLWEGLCWSPSSRLLLKLSGLDLQGLSHSSLSRLLLWAGSGES